jgi:HAD superfamily hydrolase (TIGR01450 family)
MLIDPDHLRSARGVLVDLDGTLLAGGRIVGGARELLGLVAGRFAIVSNDAEHTPEELAMRLGSFGLSVPPDRIVLAGAVALDLIARERPGAPVMLLASHALHAYAKKRGLRLVEDHPDVVVVGRDRRFSYDRLHAAANAVRAGALLVATNPDVTHPGEVGGIVPETGALLAAILACTGPTPHRIVGKPERALFLAGLEQLRCTPSEAIMIGDNEETDGRGAENLGMRFIRVEPTIERLARPR